MMTEESVAALDHTDTHERPTHGQVLPVIPAAVPHIAHFTMTPVSRLPLLVRSSHLHLGLCGSRNCESDKRGQILDPAEKYSQQGWTHTCAASLHSHGHCVHRLSHLHIHIHEEEKLTSEPNMCRLIVTISYTTQRDNC